MGFINQLVNPTLIDVHPLFYDHQLVARVNQAAPVALGVEGLLRGHGMPRWRIFLALFCWYPLVMTNALLYRKIHHF